MNVRSYKLFFFSFSVDIGDKSHRLPITNTSVAWNALRQLAQQDSIVSQPPPAKTGRLRKIANMVRLIRRSSIAAGLLKVSSDDNSYNDTFIVSVRRLFFELFLASLLLRLVRPSVRPSVSQSVSQSVGQSVGRSVSQSVSPIRQANSQSESVDSQSVSQSNQAGRQTDSQSVSQSVSQSFS